MNQDHMEQALERYNQAISLQAEINGHKAEDMTGQDLAEKIRIDPGVLANIGTIYYNQKNLTEAMKYFKGSLRAAELSSAQCSETHANTLSCVAAIYFAKK